MSIISDLDKAVATLSAAPRQPELRLPAPKDFQPGVTYGTGVVPTSITTGAIEGDMLETEADFTEAVAKMGVKVPKGYRLRLAEAKFDPAAWHRDKQGEDAVTRPVWRYRFIPELCLGTEADTDLAALHAAAKRAIKGKAPTRVTDMTMTSMVVVLGDIQAGKVDFRGGTAELLERVESAKQQVVRQVKKMRPAELILCDGGDGMEMFESSPGADRTNDLQLTEQIRVWRRIEWDWIDTLSRLVPRLKVLAVPSNHCSVRRGKQSMATPQDDFGIEVLAQCADIAAVNPEAYGHVSFHAPEKHDESLALSLVGGKVLGLTHGHQKSRPDAAPQWMAEQALGRTPIGHADIVVMNHWHNLRVQTIGDDRWLFISPTMDSGSSWYRNIRGAESEAGVLTFVVDAQGWRDMYVAWAR